MMMAAASPSASPGAAASARSLGGRLSARAVGKTHDPDDACFEALKDCSLEVDAGAFVALVGSSGCGKTTLLNMIAGFDTLSRGEIYMDGRVLAAPERRPRPGPDRVVVFQNGALFPHLYGALPLSAVRWAKPLRLDDDGRHMFPPLQD